MATIVNLTPHTIVVVDADNQSIREYPSAGVARVSTQSHLVDIIDGVKAYQTTFGKLEGLPDPEEGTFYLVSMVVAQLCSKDRLDVIAPDTGPTAYRTPDGKIIGVRQFARY